MGIKTEVILVGWEDACSSLYYIVWDVLVICYLLLIQITFEAYVSSLKDSLNLDR